MHLDRQQLTRDFADHVVVFAPVVETDSDWGIFRDSTVDDGVAVVLGEDLDSDLGVAGVPVQCFFQKLQFGDPHCSLEFSQPGALHQFNCRSLL